MRPAPPATPPAPADGSPPAPRAGRAALPWGSLTWAVAVLYFGSLFDRRWIPMDEGTLGQVALRVLRGELPHRDFDAVYTGLLDVVHAGAMAVVGVHLLAPRLVLLLAVALWVPALWALARRLVPSPGAASALVLLAVALGPPTYPASMPSWYNLFLATWGVWALLRWSEEGRARWLLAAGVLGGLSVLVKISGLYFVAAALFWVLHRTVAAPGPGRAGGASAADAAADGRAAPWTAAVATAAVATLLALEVALVGPEAGPPSWVHFVLPTAFPGALLVVRAWARRPPPAALGHLARRWGLLAAGVAAAAAPFVAVYAAAGALDDLWRGVVVLPRTRLTDVAIPPPPLAVTAGILVPFLVLFLEPRLGLLARRLLAAATLVLGVLLVATLDPTRFGVTFASLVLLVPVASLAGTVALARSRPGDPRHDALAATVWAAALLHLIRFPFDVPIYFGYVAPLGALAAGGVVAAAWRDRGGLSPRAAPATAALAAVALAFLVVGPDRGGLFGPLPPPPMAPLPLERGRIEVPVGEGRQYAALAEVVREHARGEHILATPDAPEVYFLTGYRNPTRWLFETFADASTRVAATLEALERHGVDVVVLNTRPRFSTLPPDLVEALRARYPREVTVGRFRVWWRE